MKFIQILFLLCYFFDDFQSGLYKAMWFYINKYTILSLISILAPVYDNKIRLIDIPSLRLYPGRMTTGRRKPPIPQVN